MNHQPSPDPNTPLDRFIVYGITEGLDGLPAPRNIDKADPELIASLGRSLTLLATHDPTPEFIGKMLADKESITVGEVATNAARGLRSMGARVGPFRRRKIAGVLLAMQGPSETPQDKS